MDLAEEGDLSKRLLGGVQATSIMPELFGGVFRLMSDAREHSSILTSWLWKDQLDLCKHAVRVADHNPAIPPNLFLISSGAWPRDEPALDADTRKRICTKIRDAVEESEKPWKLFCDTDGDRRPSPFTLLGYGLCNEAIVPLHLNRADLDRTETMLGMMHYYRQLGEISTQVLFVVWNFVKSQKDEPCERKGMRMPFTPTKVCLDILDSCNQRLYSANQELEGLFVHGHANAQDFAESSVAVLRQLADTVLKPSEELGLPFVEMVDRLDSSGNKTMKFKSGSVEYSTTHDVIGGVGDAIMAIEEKFEAMSLTR